jgi:hypothetical protein
MLVWVIWVVAALACGAEVTAVGGSVSAGAAVVAAVIGSVTATGGSVGGSALGALVAGVLGTILKGRLHPERTKGRIMSKKKTRWVTFFI